MTTNKRLINTFWDNFFLEFNISSLDELNTLIHQLKKNTMHFFDDEISENITLTHTKESLLFISMLQNIINFHPFVGSKFEKIVSFDENTKKVEVLLSNDLLDDDIIQQIFFSHRQEMLFYLINNNQAEKVGIFISLKHVENIIKHTETQNINHDYNYSINICEAEFRKDFFINYLIKQKKLNNIHEFIQFEILEHFIDFDKVEKNIEKLFLNGFNFLIDDFGCKFSNQKRYSRLKGIEVNIRNKHANMNFNNKLTYGLKIDGEIVASILFNNQFLDNENLSKNFNIDYFYKILTHFINFSKRIKVNHSFEFLEIQNKLIEEGLNKKKNEKLFILFYQLMNPIVENMLKRENELIQTNNIIDINHKLKKIFSLQKNENIEIIFEFLNLKEISSILLDIIKENNANSKHILLQGWLYGEKTKPILNFEE